MLIFGSSVPIITYSFACQQAHIERWIWIGIMAFLSLVCFVASLVPKFDTPKWRPVRGIMFMAAGLSAVSFIVSLLGFKSASKLPLGANVAFYAVGGYSYLQGATLYVLRIPERCKPGKFDICGASH